MVFTLSSPAFENGGQIPTRHTRNGENLSPFLQWSDPPPGTKSFVLILEDADAPSQLSRHWAVYDIPPGRNHLAEGRSSKAATEDLPHAFNDFGHQHYDGPDPQEAANHTFRFRLAALGVESLGFADDVDASRVWEAARDQLLAETDLTVTCIATSS